MRQRRLPNSTRSEARALTVGGGCETTEPRPCLEHQRAGIPRSPIIKQRPSVPCADLPLLDRWARSLVLRRLNKLCVGTLTLFEDGLASGPGGTPGGNQLPENGHRAKLPLPQPQVFGQPSTLRAAIAVHRPRFYRRIVLGGELGFAESLMDGDWTSDRLTDLIRIFIRNAKLTDQMDGGFARLSLLVERLKHVWRRNTRSGSRRNIHEHYDLGNDFYSLFLDQTMSYSSGIFETPDSTMYEASLAKLARVCQKLALRPNDHLLEIGTGWGGLAIYAAQHYGCRVTTTTISEEQFKLAKERVHRAGLSDRIAVLKRDYRDVTGQFDKLVSIEMIEAVGYEYLEAYFRQCSQRLTPEGMMLIQGIVILDQQFERYRHGVDFIRSHIFPGGCLPSIQTLANSASKSTDLRMLHLEDIGQHYVQTLRRWREKFWAEIGGVRQLGHSERFIRMWDYYLAYCEASFAERQVNNVQILWAKPECRFDPLAIDLRSCTVS